MTTTRNTSQQQIRWIEASLTPAYLKRVSDGAFKMKPEQAAFHTQKRDAKKRGIEFCFSFEEWVAWWESKLGSNWFNLRGCRRDQYVMARKGDTGPYHSSNVNCIIHQQNTRDIKRSPIVLTSGAERQRRYIQRLKTGVNGELVTKLRGRIKDLKDDVEMLVTENEGLEAKLASLTAEIQPVSDGNIIADNIRRRYENIIAELREQVNRLNQQNTDLRMLLRTKIGTNVGEFIDENEL